MKRALPGIALAAMLLIPAAVRAEDNAPPAEQPMHVTLSITNVGSSDDADKVTTALKGVKGVTEVTGLTADSKKATVTYTPSQVSTQQIAQAVADVPGKDNNPYQASLLIHVDNLSDPATQDKATGAVKKVTGVADATVMDAAAGTLAVKFSPMEADDKAGGVKGATQDQILKALKDAGLTASTDIPAPVPAVPAQ